MYAINCRQIRKISLETPVYDDDRRNPIFYICCPISVCLNLWAPRMWMYDIHKDWKAGPFQNLMARRRRSVVLAIGIGMSQATDRKSSWGVSFRPFGGGVRGGSKSPIRTLQMKKKNNIYICIKEKRMEK